MVEVTVTQEDRDAALWMGENVLRWTQMQIAIVEQGDGDDAPLVQAFARHRTTALAAKEAELAAERAKVEKLREALERAAQSFDAMAFALNSEQLFAAGKRAEGWAAQARAALSETQP